MENENEFIPVNFSGKPLDLEAKVNESSIGEAIRTFDRACKPLLNPPLWHSLAGSFSAKFFLVTAQNADPHRLIEPGDFLKIDIPGPGPSEGDGYDWVRVTASTKLLNNDADQIYGLKLQASQNPLHNNNVTAHFFKEEATSTFIIKRNGLSVQCNYHGRNEMPNNSNTALTDKLRNTLVAGSAVAGISALQWQALINGLLEKEIGG